jgi:hypothetical protein
MTCDLHEGKFIVAQRKERGVCEIHDHLKKSHGLLTTLRSWLAASFPFHFIHISRLRLVSCAGLRAVQRAKNATR